MDGTTLMARRIRRILLVCNSYDRFSLEEDGRIESRIAEEYADLNLSNPPVLRRVETTTEALQALASEERFDLVLTMYYGGALNVFDFAVRAKEIDSTVPIVLLSSFSKEVFRKIEDLSDGSCIDYVFCWNNSPDLIIAIIKLLEDRMNAETDILQGGVQAILLVEDSVRYYSTYLPMLYRIILRQNTESLSDALGEQQKVARKRSRPKILMATNYAEAIELYEKYKRNLLGVISDVGFVMKRGDRSADEKSDAGVDLCRHIKADDFRMPFLMQSSQLAMKAVAEKLGVGFLYKASKMLDQELSDYMEQEFGFGDFIVKDHRTGHEIGRARDLYEFENLVRTMPAQEFVRLTEGNYLSKWLYARGLFPLGKIVHPLRNEDYESVELHRGHILEIIHDYRISQALGVVATFDPKSYNDTIWFSRFGEGSLGGKARGLAFLNHILQKYDLYDAWDHVRVTVPRTLVITSDWFDRFIQENGLGYVINSDMTDAELLSEFVASPLPRELLETLRSFVSVVRTPLAVRSSSRLEDSYYQPFAGVYSTYMLPGTGNVDQQLRLLSKAVASVYASVFFSSAKGYILSSGNVLAEEKMAVVIQEVCGSEDGGYFFPTLSGVARSVNFYPTGHEKAEEGIAKVAYGLGKAVVDGEQVLRFSPRHPRHVLQTSTPELTMRDSQKAMYALSLRPERFKTSVDDAVNLERLDIADCTRFRSFGRVASTWDRQNLRIVDSALPEGPKFVTFTQMLQYDTFPLAGIVDRLLEITKTEMKSEVEIEFAADFKEDGSAVFTVLQVRPISADTRFADVDWNKIDTAGAFLTSGCALGTGWLTGVEDVVYLKPAAWNVLETLEMAREVSEINATMLAEGRSYVLLGFGRWGSSIPSLGVPVKWSDISEARAIVECALEHFRVDPSQGTHFFQNLTSFNVGYVSVDPWARKEDSLDFSALDVLPAVRETRYLRQVRFPSEIRICIDGKTGRAMMGK